MTVGASLRTPSRRLRRRAVRHLPVSPHKFGRAEDSPNAPPFPRGRCAAELPRVLAAGCAAALRRATAPRTHRHSCRTALPNADGQRTDRRAVAERRRDRPQRTRRERPAFRHGVHALPRRRPHLLAEELQPLEVVEPPPVRRAPPEQRPQPQRVAAGPGPRVPRQRHQPERRVPAPRSAIRRMQASINSSAVPFGAHGARATSSIRYPPRHGTGEATAKPATRPSRSATTTRRSSTTPCNTSGSTMKCIGGIGLDASHSRRHRRTPGSSLARRRLPRGHAHRLVPRPVELRPDRAVGVHGPPPLARVPHRLGADGDDRVILPPLARLPQPLLRARGNRRGTPRRPRPPRTRGSPRRGRRGRRPAPRPRPNSRDTARTRRRRVVRGRPNVRGRGSGSGNRSSSTRTGARVPAPPPAARPGQRSCPSRRMVGAARGTSARWVDAAGEFPVPGVRAGAAAGRCAPVRRARPASAHAPAVLAFPRRNRPCRGSRPSGRPPRSAGASSSIDAADCRRRATTS